jgi:hypothetical protein
MRAAIDREQQAESSERGEQAEHAADEESLQS